MFKTLYLYLIIGALFLTKSFGQNIQLNIQGQSVQETNTIDSIGYNKYHKDFITVKKELNNTSEKIKQVGYINAKISSLTKTNDSTYQASINLYNKFNTLYIYYDNNLIDPETLKSVSSNIKTNYFVIPFSKTEKTLQFLNSKISEKGFPFVNIKLSNIRIRNEDSVEGSLVISNNSNKRGLNKIILKGYDKFPKSYLKHYLNITPNETFNLTSIKKKINRLEDLRFANKIKDPEILFTKDSTALYLYLEKNKSNAFDGFLGFGNNEETTDIKFNGYLNLDLNNNLNYGESFNLVYKSDENEQRTLNVKLNLPYLFNSTIGTELDLKIFKKDSSFTTVNQSGKLYYQVNSRNNIYIGVKNTTSENLLDASNIGVVKDFNSTLYTTSYQYIDRTDYRKIFQNKVSVYFEAGLGNRTFEDTKTKQTEINLKASKIFSLNQSNSIFIKLNGYSLISDDYFENELERFGGINSIRGFEENSLTGNQFGLINTEYRYQLSKTIYIHSIIDAAYLENKISNQKEKLYGYGLGLGILTKAGLLKFNYANGKSENQRFSFSNSKIHLSLTTVF